MPNQYKLLKNNSANYLNTKTLENWIKSAADLLRGSSEGLKYIITLFFYKRICDIYNDELKLVSQRQVSRKTWLELCLQEKSSIQTPQFFNALIIGLVIIGIREWERVKKKKKQV